MEEADADDCNTAMLEQDSLEQYRFWDGMEGATVLRLLLKISRHTCQHQDRKIWQHDGSASEQHSSAIT